MSFATPQSGPDTNAANLSPHEKHLVNLGWQSPTKSFSVAADFDEPNTKTLEETFHVIRPKTERQDILTSKDHGEQFAMVWNGRYFMVSATKSYRANGKHVIVGNFSDDFMEFQPSEIPYKYFYGHFTSLATKKDIEEFNLPFSKDPTDQIVTPGDEQGSWANTKFDNIEPANADSHPFIVALPLVFPLPKGDSFDGNPLVSDGAPTLTKLVPAWLMWCTPIN